MWNELIGERVVLRRRAGDHQFSDVLGRLEGAGDPLRVRRENGEVVAVAAADVHRLKAVPPRVVRPRDALALEEIASLGWPAPDHAWLGRWLLRAAKGWTGRANSALPLGDPGLPVDEAIGRVRGWYAERGLPARFQIPLPGAENLDGALGGLGFTVDSAALVQTANVGMVLAVSAERPDLPPVSLDPTPSRDWLATYHYRGGSGVPAVGLRVMTAARLPVFATVRDAGTAVAVARGVVDEGWLGVTAVEVAESHRRRGLASHIMRALAGWGSDNGAHSVYVQVADHNSGAFAFYERLGFTTHHRYHYRVG